MHVRMLSSLVSYINQPSIQGAASTTQSTSLINSHPQASKVDKNERLHKE